jgi:hypothetical protein
MVRAVLPRRADLLPLGGGGARYWVPMTPALLMCLWFALEPLRRRQDLFRALWVLHILAALA